jgi:4-amino-4-deoxy-L-arabinose transferase-like glycosyltransferase
MFTLMPFIKKHPNAIATVILALFFAVSLLVSSKDSTTMDEKAHIPSAYSYVLYGDMRLNPEHPPLLKDLAGLPLLFLHPVFPSDAWEWTNGINEQWVMGDKLLHTNGNNAQLITFMARLPILLIAVGLGIAIYLWVGQWLGVTAGLFALTLYAFDPNVLGHNHLVTTDLGIAAFTFISTITFLRWLKNPTMGNTFLFGVILGLVQLAKFSAVILFPFFFIIALIYIFARHKRIMSESIVTTTEPAPSSIWKLLWEYTWKYTIVVILCFVAIEILYLFNTLHMPAEKIRIISDSVFKSDNAAAHIARATIDWMVTVPILKPLAEYFLGVFMVFARVAGGNTYFFFGTVSNHATPLYFPAVFILKETLPLLILILFGIGFSLYRFFASAAHRTETVGIWLAKYFERHITQVTMLGFVLFYAYLSITSNLNIGFRHLFPMLPFIYVLVTKLVVDACHAFHQHSDTNHQFAKVFTGLFVFWIIAIPIIAYPSYISYFNEAVGGHSNGYKYVTDSNYDWGQDLARLREWVDRYNRNCQHVSMLARSCTDISHGQPIDTLRIDYFGGSSPEYYFGTAFKSWHGELAPEPGWYAISAGFFQESSYKERRDGEWSYAWLNKYPMVARAGDSIFIFYVPEVK